VIKIKTLIQHEMKKLGIEIRKFPAVAFEPVPVFHLSVELLMLRKTTALRFIQVGANDGYFGDPLHRYITRKAWHGILIEPQPDVFDRLCANYSAARDRLIFENVAISDKCSTFELFRPPADSAAKPYNLSVVSGNPRGVARQLNLSPSQLVKIVVAAVRLDQLVEKHKFFDFDVLQIDAEGYDWHVLRSLDLCRSQPTIIQLEVGHLSRADCTEAVKYMTEHGYQIYWGGYQGDLVALKSGFTLS
jgi:FkbM family methyltransferase